METRERMIKDLQGVKAQIARILNIMDEQAKIVASFRQSEASISTTGMKAKLEIAKYAIGFTLVVNSLLYRDLTGAVLHLALLAFLYCYRGRKTVLKKLAAGSLYLSLLYLPFYALETISDGYILAGMIPLMLFAAGIGGALYLISTQNRRIDEKNRQIRQHNDVLQEQYAMTVRQADQHRRKLNQMIAGWYPKDYCSMDAVNFFISSIENYKADTIKEAVVLFDDAQHKKKMLSSQRSIEEMNRRQLINQEAISKQLRFANMLSVANLSLQFSNLGAIQSNTDAINRASYRASGDANRVVEAINRLGR